ncbi:hypothetical protein FISHEDRAFT_56301 [Fistulina hepatica ATCC 64428]|uniref:C2H2-type domain-containing protein n=1 Tax=Fistulina hepatica ATCC 64428 TaxID=1128425 RepID=A0A0D7AJZ0_9AGAR|nr:hypothetical protein FISHEDRAFT_56301 [Fistulina hepatica ATCC 64428]
MAGALELDDELALSALRELQFSRINDSFNNPGAGIVSNVPFFGPLSEPSVAQQYTDTQFPLDESNQSAPNLPANFVFDDAFASPAALDDTTTVPSDDLEQRLVAFLDGVETANELCGHWLPDTQAGDPPPGVRRKRPLRSPRTPVIPFDTAGVASPGPSTLAVPPFSSGLTSNFTFVLTNGQFPSSRKRRRQEFVNGVREIKKMKPSAEAISLLIKEANRDVESISVLLGVEKNCLKVSQPCKVSVPCSWPLDRDRGEKQDICHFDLRNCADTSAISDHMRECHGAASSYSCPWKKCSYDTATRAHMSQHLFGHIGHYVQCPFARCKTTLKDESLGRHIRNRHNGDILAVVEGKKESSQLVRLSQDEGHSVAEPGGREMDAYPEEDVDVAKVDGPGLATPAASKGMTEVRGDLRGCLRRTP